jgi:hypothetical protein
MHARAPPHAARSRRVAEGSPTAARSPPRRRGKGRTLQRRHAGARDTSAVATRERRTRQRQAGRAGALSSRGVRAAGASASPAQPSPAARQVLAAMTERMRGCNPGSVMSERLSCGCKLAGRRNGRVAPTTRTQHRRLTDGRTGGSHMHAQLRPPLPACSGAQSGNAAPLHTPDTSHQQQRHTPAAHARHLAHPAQPGTPTTNRSAVLPSTPTTTSLAGRQAGCSLGDSKPRRHWQRTTTSLCTPLSDAITTTHHKLGRGGAGVVRGELCLHTCSPWHASQAKAVQEGWEQEDVVGRRRVPEPIGR